MPSSQQVIKYIAVTWVLALLTLSKGPPCFGTSNQDEVLYKQVCVNSLIHLNMRQLV